MKFFDEFSHLNRPADLPGMNPIKVVYGDQWEFHSTIPEDQNTPVDGSQEVFSRYTYIPTITKHEPICLDVEHYGWGDRSLHTDAIRLDSRQKLLHYLKIWKQERPQQTIGYYAIGPYRDYWRATGTEIQALEWQADSREMQEVFNAQDILYPSVYIFYDDQDRNEDYIFANIEEARVVGNAKPIYPFVWPYYHPSNATLGHQLIDADYFDRILNNVKDAGADGMVFWGGWQLEWSDFGSTETWNVIQKFVEDNSSDLMVVAGPGYTYKIYNEV